jgi:hypothetical protein
MIGRGISNEIAQSSSVQNEEKGTDRVRRLVEHREYEEERLFYLTLRLAFAGFLNLLAFID